MHLRPCKEIAEAHNYRCKELDYVRSKLSNKNENWMWDENKCLADRREEIRKLVKEKTGRKMQTKAVPLHEGVVVIDEYTTMEDLKKLGKAFQNRFGCECIHISIHRDEGHWVDKDGYDVGLKPTDNPTEEQISNGVTWKPNLHAHMVFDWYNHETGKSIRTSKQDARDMQTICAEILSMERGQQSTKKHLDGLSFKLAEKNQEARDQEEYLNELENDINKAEEKFKEVDLRLSDGLKELSAIKSSMEEINALKTQKNDEIRDLERRIKERKEELRREPLEITTARQHGKEEGRKMAVNEILDAAGLHFGNNNATVTTEMVGKDWRKKFDQAKEAEQGKMQKAYSLFQCVANAVDAIRTFVFKIRYSFSEEEEEDIYKALDGKADNAPALREAAYNLGGVICQYQYAGKWEQAERELERIAKGQEQQQNYERERGRGL